VLLAPDAKGEFAVAVQVDAAEVSVARVGPFRDVAGVPAAWQAIRAVAEEVAGVTAAKAHNPCADAHRSPSRTVRARSRPPEVRMTRSPWRVCAVVA
jgi:hypothetical protein